MSHRFLIPSVALILLLSACQSQKSYFELTSSSPNTFKVPLPPPPKPIPKVPSIPVLSAAPITTPSGLRYQVLASGPVDGRSPTISDAVAVHYRGTLANGTVFDSSYDRGQPTTFPVRLVIAGWTEALQLMKPGDKWLLHIPSRLAYGPQGMPPYIPPNSDLIFQVELLQIQ